MTHPSKAQVVWFKRDLRVQDHAPLCEAAAAGPVIALFIVEPEWLASADFDRGHYDFVRQSLMDLDEALRERGGALLVRRGEAVEVLRGLREQHPFDDLWSHEETGNAVTYARDRRVARWCRDVGVRWHERPNNGVFRRLASRDGWSARWQKRMSRPVLPPPGDLRAPAPSEPPPLADALALRAPRLQEPQLGGERQAHETLQSFLRVRGVNYRQDMSSPLSGWSGCSRMSPYLAWGNLSVRQVHHATLRRQRWVKAARASAQEVDPRWATSLSSFQSRLRWHCHFIQKLESQPSIEHDNIHRGYDGLREGEHDEVAFERLKAGQTGFPMVDACVRSLTATGWLNFRMRAMLVSFACWDLWLHWRPVALWLAPLFLDYEPGIHFSQCQMQAGTAGINTTRVYSPTKQALDQDPTGAFIRRWVPELAQLPTPALAAPWRAAPLELQLAGVGLDQHYPTPMVDHARAAAEAKRRYFAVKRRADVREEARRVFERHGSRRGPPRSRRRR